MSDAQAERGVAAIVAAFVEADFDRVPALVREGTRGRSCAARPA